MVEHEIFHLQISMNHAIFMQELQNVKHLLKVVASDWVIKTLDVDKIKKFPIFYEF